jgi:hypothetical protein
MKILLFTPLLGLLLLASSCRTAKPVDPATMKPSDRCMPGNLHSGAVEGTK